MHESRSRFGHARTSTLQVVADHHFVRPRPSCDGPAAVERSRRSSRKRLTQNVRFAPRGQSRALARSNHKYGFFDMLAVGCNMARKTNVRNGFGWTTMAVTLPLALLLVIAFLPVASADEDPAVCKDDGTTESCIGYNSDSSCVGSWSSNDAYQTWSGVCAGDACVGYYSGYYDKNGFYDTTCIGGDYRCLGIMNAYNDQGTGDEYDHTGVCMY